MMIVENASGGALKSLSHNLNDDFWRWFGTSKVLGRHGPLVVFHGTNAHAYVDGQIDVFHTLPSSGRGAAFFSSSPELAGEYGEKVYRVYLRIENPLIVFGDGKNWSMLDDTARVAGAVTDKLRLHHQKQASQVDDILRDLAMLDGDQENASPSQSKIPDNVDNLDRFTLSIFPGMDGFASTDDIVRQARRMGYDGVIFRQVIDSPTSDRHLYKGAASDVFAVFSPSQIKSVQNDGQWSRDDPDIMH